MKKTVAGILAGVLLLLAVNGTSALAAKAEWSDNGYNFVTSQFILVMEPQFSYEGFDVSGRNKFNKYPYASDKIRDMLNARFGGLTKHRFVNMDYVLRQIQADPTLAEPYDPKSPGFAAMVQRETAKHVQLVLYLDVRDYGWFYEYHDAYQTIQTKTERIYYTDKHPDGTESSGWRDIPRTIVEYTPAGYFISDSAGAAFRLFDTKNGKDVWKYSDSRTRRSPSISNGYDPTGPESMMGRIFDDAFKKIPIAQ